MSRYSLRSGGKIPSHVGASLLVSGSRLPCHFLGVAVYTSRGCRHVQEITVAVREICGTEIVIQSPLCNFLPEAFTLVLGARQYGMGCIVHRRYQDRLVCRLIRREPAAIVAFLSTLAKPEQTLSLLLSPLFPPGRHSRMFPSRKN